MISIRLFAPTFEGVWKPRELFWNSCVCGINFWRICWMTFFIFFDQEWFSESGLLLFFNGSWSIVDFFLNFMRSQTFISMVSDGEIVFSRGFLWRLVMLRIVRDFWRICQINIFWIFLTKHSFHKVVCSYVLRSLEASETFLKFMRSWTPIFIVPNDKIVISPQFLPDLVTGPFRNWRSLVWILSTETYSEYKITIMLKQRACELLDVGHAPIIPNYFFKTRPFLIYPDAKKNDLVLHINHSNYLELKMFPI